jgi:hypothetical protein
MDDTFLKLVSLIVNQANTIAALQKELEVLKSGLPVEEASK